ncbi:GmrSD restriction endonuclease domain-containing protein [Mucilaginibacter ginsenosidivorans]|uniref:DUF262 domain-containing protein n=1 Tax=Mucilaginibacter ginsenosidivorans TaxID=398053 RepID=A0A5B8USS3_9SPHI|nr:DUF262 domain-containing protein [Mucilaginibacter ginsenosidivorans]QEC61982.1 DUF262 domain-containing protein [Mucilaginibacter ginsenosidivorans]
MKIIPEVWTIRKLIELRPLIDPRPQYQRTAVWSRSKQKLLIDSILRGYDIPKFYLRKTPPESSFKYEVTDGQQRMIAIWEFVDGVYHLDESMIGSVNTSNLTYTGLEAISSFRLGFVNYKLNISTIEQASQEEIRTLFARLQMGERLNPAELRHALASNIGNAIASIVENNEFFSDDCKISNTRYKHQDYLDNALTLSKYDGARSVKAVDMKHLYTEFASTALTGLQPLMQNTDRVLRFMKEINRHKKGIFKNKWAFVDVFYLLFKNLAKIENVHSRIFADSFSQFEILRRQHNANPEALIENKRSLDYDKDLYDYIIAFKTAGAEKGNALIRYRVMHNKFLNDTNFIFIK